MSTSIERTSQKYPEITTKYYVPNSGEESCHDLLKNATILQSDYPWIRRTVAVWSSIMNAQVGNFHPVLSLFSLFSKSHRDYKQELAAISKLTPEEKEKIEKNTFSHGGETETAYAELVEKYNNWKSNQTLENNPPTELFWYSRSDSLAAARDFKETHSQANIAITSFANAVRVGGADSTGGKGSQEEQLFRKTYLRVSLESAKEKADQEILSKTGRYLHYYATIVSKEIPTIADPTECYGFASVSAPDLRQGIHSEGNYFRDQHNNSLVKEVLYRKLSVVMMATAIEGFNVLELGAFGCGAFGNKPEVVAEVIKDLLAESRFSGVFTHIVLPIGARDPNRIFFKNVFNGT